MRIAVIGTGNVGAVLGAALCGRQTTGTQNGPKHVRTKGVSKRAV